MRWQTLRHERRCLAWCSRHVCVFMCVCVVTRKRRAVGTRGFDLLSTQRLAARNNGDLARTGWGGDRLDKSGGGTKGNGRIMLTRASGFGVFLLGFPDMFSIWLGDVSFVSVCIRPHRRAENKYKFSHCPAGYDSKVTCRPPAYNSHATRRRKRGALRNLHIHNDRWSASRRGLRSSHPAQN